MRKGNVIATTLIIVALLVSATLMIQRDVFESESSVLQKTLNAFSRHVYEGPDDLVERYAQNGYQAGFDSLWYCSDKASPPSLEQTKAEFSEFATADLLGRLETLGEEFPGMDIDISRPTFTLEGPDLFDDLPNESVDVTVSNLTVTIRDGDRLIQTSYDQENAYALRFWMMYRTMQDWIKCNNGGIYSAIESIFSHRVCAFFKDMNHCAHYDWTYCEPRNQCTPWCNCCPCDEDLPLYTEELCDGSDPEKIQDFATVERTQLKRDYGVKNSDLQNIANAVSDELTATFNGESICPSIISEPTGITCKSRIENPRVRNGFFSSYVYHNTGCVEQVEGVPGAIIPIHELDTLACGGAQFCPDFGSVLESPATIADALAAITGIPIPQCEYEPILDSEGNPTGEFQVRCEDGTVISPDDIGLADCRLDPTRASQGAAGDWPGAPTQPINCNPLPPDSDPGPGDRASTALKQGDQDIKCLATDWKPTEGETGYWFGVNGWLDRKGTFDLIITCSDPGVPGVQPMEAEIKLHVSFRHGCDSDQGRMRGWAPPLCGVPGVGSEQDCNLDCNDNPCIYETCEFIDPDGPSVPSNMHCVYVNDNPSAKCPSADNDCMLGACVGVGADRACSFDTLVPDDSGARCGPEDDQFWGCNKCGTGAQAGQCLPSLTSSCTGQGNANSCQEYKCAIGEGLGPSGGDIGICLLHDKVDPECNPNDPRCDTCVCENCNPGGESTGACKPAYQLRPDPACGDYTYWPNCIASETVEETCEGTTRRGYTCEPPNGLNEIPAEECCPARGPGAQHCSNPNQPCCQFLNTCMTEDDCDAAGQ